MAQMLLNLKQKRVKTEELRKSSKAPSISCCSKNIKAKSDVIREFSPSKLPAANNKDCEDHNKDKTNSGIGDGNGDIEINLEMMMMTKMAIMMVIRNESNDIHVRQHLFHLYS